MLTCCLGKGGGKTEVPIFRTNVDDSVRVRSWSIPAEYDNKVLKDAGFSFTSFNGNSCRKISHKDSLNYKKVKTLISADYRKFAALSTLVKKQIDRMTFNSLEKKNYQDAGGMSEQVLEKIVPFVEDLMQTRQKKKEMNKDFALFNLKTPPRMSLRFYLSRLMAGLNNWYYKDEEATEIGIRCLFLSLHYIDSLPDQIPDFQVTKINIYKLFATFMLLAAKFTEDEVISNSYWALISGYTAEEVTELETTMCFKLEFVFDADPASIHNIFNFFNEKRMDFGRDSLDDGAPIGVDTYINF